MNYSTPCSQSFTVSQSLLKLMFIESMMASSHLILCCCFLLPSVFPGIRVFSRKSALHIMWPKYWSFSFSICPSNEYSGLISFRMDWLDLLAVQGTLQEDQESSPTPQFKSINSSALSFLYSPTLTFIHDYWKNHSFAYTDLCWRSSPPESSVYRDSPGKITGVVCHAVLQEIFPTQG